MDTVNTGLKSCYTSSFTCVVSVPVVQTVERWHLQCQSNIIAL